MAQEKPNRLAEWLLMIREQTPVLRRRFEDWADAVRERPALIWETAAVRYGVYATGGLMLVWVVSWIPALFAPQRPGDARPTATTADFHVVCVNLDCEHHFVIHRKFGFRKFPVVCPTCEKKTGAQARRCNSRVCRGRWVVPEAIDGVSTCAHCGSRFE